MPDTDLHILLVDDDAEFVGDFRVLLSDSMRCTVSPSAAQAFDYLKTHQPDVVFLDIDLGSGENGLEFLGRLKTEWPYLPVIMISGIGDIDTVVQAMRQGASDYIGKHPDLDKLKIAIHRVISQNLLQQKYDLLKTEMDSLVGDLVGEGEAMTAVRKNMMRVAAVSSNVLITGESGTGKELVARRIHGMSSRAANPFIAVNCAALARELVESELFGHEKGAFTNAYSQRMGKFELVGMGTLFLDEITEIPPAVQAKLLRVLQEREFERVGGNRLIPFNGRVLASTNRDIDKAVADGILRQDLLFRLNVTSIHLPPLRERREDIPALIDYFIRVKSTEMKRIIESITDNARQALMTYNWPGNVRELSNWIENAIVYATTEKLDVCDFDRLSGARPLVMNYDEAKKQAMTRFQRQYISALLTKNNGNVSQTAIDMGVSRQGLIKMMTACGLDKHK